MKGKTMVPTAQEVAATLQPQNPHLKFAYSTDGYLVGVWSDEAGRYVSKVSRTIVDTMPWVLMPYEIKINGQLPPVEWIPLAV